MKISSYISGVLLMAGLLGGCASSTGKFEVSTLNGLKNDEIVIVGKIRLDPVIDKIEQPLYLAFPFNLLHNSDQYRNKMFITIGNKHVDVSKTSIWSEASTSVDLEKTFFIKVKRSSTLFYSGGAVKLFLESVGDGNIYFPAGLKYQIHPNDKAIYIGTIEYYRDFGEVEKISLIDEYKAAREEFVQKFGTTIQLRQVKASKV